jgi:hypothetical protein
MTTTTATTALGVHSVAADEGMLWSLTAAGEPGILGSAAAAVFEPISAADHLTAELEAWVAPADDPGGTDGRWTALLDRVLAGLHVVGVDRVVTVAGTADGDRLRALLAGGFRITALERDRLRLQLDVSR